MKKKFLLPMMAFVFAIGLSFATERSTADPMSDYVHENGLWIEIPEQLCLGAEGNCVIQFSDNPGVELDVYDARRFDTKKTGGTDHTPVIERP